MTCSNACELGTRRERSLVAVGNLVCGVPADRAHVREAGTLHRPGACAEIGRCLIQGGLGGWVCERKKWVACESNAPSVERVEPSSPECQPAEKKAKHRSVFQTQICRSVHRFVFKNNNPIFKMNLFLDKCSCSGACLPSKPPGGWGKEHAAPGRASALCLFRTRLHESDGGKTDAFDATTQSGQAVEEGGLSLYRLPSRFPHKQLSEFTR